MKTEDLKLGAYSGLAGGVVFGVMMAMMGMLPMIGSMVGHPSAVIGFLVHLVISALVGASFAVLFGGLVHGTGEGLGYGLAWIGCRLLSRSPMVHVDGPLSVQNAFTVDEARSLANKSGLQSARIVKHWPQRFLMTWQRT